MQESKSTQPLNARTGADTTKPSAHTAMSLAVYQVFNSPELLESILLHVPGKDLITHVPRVSKTFKATVDDSPALRRLLFRQADATTTLSRPKFFPYLDNPSGWLKKEAYDYGLTFTCRVRDAEEIVQLKPDGPLRGLRKLPVFQPAVRRLGIRTWYCLDGNDAYCNAMSGEGKKRPEVIEVDDAREFTFGEVLNIFKIVVVPELKSARSDLARWHFHDRVPSADGARLLRARMHIEILE